MAILHPQECFLLEKFSSVEQFAETRDAIMNWVSAHEAAYERLISDLDPRQRRKPQWQQGDFVWGSRVLPNIRPQVSQYQKYYIQRVNKDLHAFNAGCSMSNNNRGIGEFWDGWMLKEEIEKISDLCMIATELDGQLGSTADGTWSEGILTYNFCSQIYSGSIPDRLPRYQLDPSVRVEEGEQPEEWGIYLPDVENAAAQFLIPRKDGEGINVRQGLKRSAWGVDAGQASSDWEESQWTKTGWTLIRRVENEFIVVPEEGFFPRGTPDELYSWPERESQYVRRDAQHICAMSDEAAVHSGKWAYTGRNGLEYCDIQQGKYLPRRKGETVKWTLIQRSDGGSCLVP